MHKAQAIYVIPDTVDETSVRYEEDAVFLASISIVKYLNLYACREASGNYAKENFSPSHGVGQRYPNKANTMHWWQSPKKYHHPQVIVKMTASLEMLPFFSQQVYTVLSTSELRMRLMAFGTAFPGFAASL